MNKYYDNISAPIYSIEDEVIHFLKSWLQEEKLTFEKNNQTIEPESIQIINRVAKLRKQLDNTYELLEKGLYSKELFV